MMPVVKIICENNGAELSVNMGTSLYEVTNILALRNPQPFLAAYVNNRIKELDYKIYKPVSVRFIDITHYEGYRTIRAKNPDVPIVMASRPDYWTRNYTFEYHTVEETEKRRRLIEGNYLRALAEGDRNVYFVDGSKIYPEELRNECSSDGCHPTDLGFYRFVNAYQPKIAKILKKYNIK